MKKAINQKANNQKVAIDKETIYWNLMQRIYELASLSIKVGTDNPLFMEIIKIQCELIKLKKGL